MPVFIYKGRRNGELVEGNQDGDSASAVASMLVSQGITPVQIKEQASPLEAIQSSSDKKLKALKLQELVIFSRQMHTLMKAGVPVIRALYGLSENTRHPTTSVLLKEMAKDLEAGNSLSAAMQLHKKHFSNLFISLISVGESTGQLDEAFKQVGNYLEQEHQTRQRIKAATRYPVMVISAIMIALVVVNLVVIPAFAKLFSSYDKALPMPTQILISISNFFVDYWPLMLIAMMAAGGFLWSYLKTPQGLISWHYFKIKLPFVGSIFERSVLARFCRSLSVMLTAGIPILNALKIVAHAVDNEYVGVKIDKIREATERGESLTNSAIESKMFTPLVMQMIAVGEETGSLDELLLEVAEFYEGEVDYDLQKLSAAIEPTLIIIIAIMVLILALGVFLPLWELSTAIK